MRAELEKMGGEWEKLEEDGRVGKMRERKVTGRSFETRKSLPELRPSGWVLGTQTCCTTSCRVLRRVYKVSIFDILYMKPP